MVSLSAPAVSLNLFRGVICRTNSDIEQGCWRYRAVSDDESDLTTDIPANVVDADDDIFMQETLWETGGGFTFTTRGR